MGTSISQSPSPPHLYSQALQLKLYQAFIFSIPILFSIILFLLFYLFYLKRRAASFASHTPPILPTSSNQATAPIFMNAVCEVGLKGDLKDKLPKIVFDEDIKARDSICCVCLGEFELKEELVQVPSCEHVFHVDCIRHWLCSNATCPLCRCFVVVVPHTTTQLMQLPLSMVGNFQASNLQQQQQQQEVGEQVSNTSTSSSSSSSSSRTTTTIVGSSLPPESVVLQVQHPQ